MRVKSRRPSRISLSRSRKRAPTDIPPSLYPLLAPPFARSQYPSRLHGPCCLVGQTLLCSFFPFAFFSHAPLYIVLAPPSVTTFPPTLLLQNVCCCQKHIYRSGFIHFIAKIGLVLSALGDLEDIRVDAEGGDGCTGTSALDNQRVGETLGGEGDDVVAALERSEGMAGRVSVCG